jgi:polyphosphate glucokinase
VQADYVVVGGGNAKRLKSLPPRARVGHNRRARDGGIRLWRA